MLYSSILLVLLVILYYYYTRIYEGLDPLPKPTAPKPTLPVITETTVPTAAKPVITATTVPKPNSPVITTVPTTTSTLLKKNKIDSASQVKQIKQSYLKFYQSLTDADKVEIKGMFNHLVENVIKDDYPQIT